MYNYINGTVTYITSSNITIENNGIGYLILVPNPYQFTKGETITIFLHYYVREDAILLYGFRTIDERDMFLRLINVKGLGPKGALAILASSSVSEIINAINEANASFFIRFPGIGTKSSQQIILDLKGKLDINNLEKTNKLNPKFEDVSQALKALGYNSTEIKTVIKKLPNDDTSVAELIKQALRLIR